MSGSATVVEQLVAAVDHLCDVDPASVADSDTIEILHRQLARLDAATTRATAAFDTGGEWANVGARSCAAWVAVRCKIPLAEARRRCRLARQLRHMPVVGHAWLAGDLHGAQAALLARARTPATAEAFARDEEMLVGEALKLRHEQFARALAYWSQLADPDSDDDRATKRHQQRRAHLSPGIDGTMILDAIFDPLGGAAFANVLKRIERHLFEADWAKAKRRLGREPTVLDLDRSPAQRRHDALVEMARRAAATPPGARLPEPLFCVLVDYQTFAGRVCELERGTVIPPAALVPWLPQAWVERVVFDSPDRVKNVGVKRRIFQGATRRAVQIRDRDCYHPYCDQPAPDCQVDHIEPWGAGGLTTDTNGRPACGYHNRQRHRRPRPDEPPDEPPE